MDSEKFKEYLESRYNDQIDWYDRKAGDNQRVYRRLQTMVIILSAITPVLVVIDPNRVFQWVTAGIAAMVAIGTTLLKTFKYQENWINYRTTCETLRKEKYFYDARLLEYGDADDPEAVFVNRVESLISRENTMWLSAHHREEEKNKNPQPTGE